MWRSLVAASASLSRQGARNFFVARNLEVPLSESVARLQHSSTWIAVAGSCFFRNPRFFSQHSSNSSDSDSVDELKFVSSEAVDFGESDDAEVGSSLHDNEINEFDGELIGVEENGNLLEGDGALSNEEDGEEEEKIYEVNSEQLESLLSLMDSSLDGSFDYESSLDEMGLTLHEDFVLKVLQTPLIVSENLLRFFKWALNNQPKFKVTTPVVDAFVRSVCRSTGKRDAYSLWDLIKEMGEKQNELLNAEILNQLIALFSRLGKGKAALEVLDKFEAFGCVPNAESYYLTIEALCRRSFFDWAWSVCERMLDAGAFPEKSYNVGKIVSWFCKGNKAKDVHSVYLLAKEKNLGLPRSSMNFLISSLCRHDETVELALEMLNDFSADERKRTIKPHLVVLRGLFRIKNTSEAKALLLKMIAEGPPPGNAAFNTVINGYSKAGDLGEAMEMMKLMESRGLRPDVYTYTVIISGFANGGQMKEAYEVFDEAKEKHSKLSPVTYHTLIRNHCKLDEFDQALKLLGEMKDFGVQPNADEYSKLIQSLCLKRLDWKTAEKLAEEMEANGLHLNGITKGLMRAVKELEEEEEKEEEEGTGELSLAV